MLKLRRTKPSKLELLKDSNSQDVIDIAKVAELGLPYHSTSFAYEPTLNLLAVGSKNGVIKIVGNNGVELDLDLGDEVEVKRLLFLKFRIGIIIIYTVDNTFYMEIYRVSNIDTTTSLLLDGKKKFDQIMKITACKVSTDESYLYIGTSLGHTFTFDIDHMEFTTLTINQDDVLKQLGQTSHYGLGSVENISSPTNSTITTHHQQQKQQHRETMLLIGYRRGTLILVDIYENKIDNYFNVGPDLESVFWHPSGKMFLTCHTEGTIVHWTLFDENCKGFSLNFNSSPKSNNSRNSGFIQQPNNHCSLSQVVPYGPSHCRPVNQIYWFGSLFLFSNGTSYKDDIDSNTITLMAGGTFLHVYSFSSPIIKFDVIVNGGGAKAVKGGAREKTFIDPTLHWDCYPTHLIVLTEQELVIVAIEKKYTLQRHTHDLKKDNKSIVRSEKLFPAHFPCIQFVNISCIKIVDNCSDNFINNLMMHGKIYGHYEEYGWPILGGFPKVSFVQRNDILITGHENGDILFWWTRPQTTYKLVTKFSTCSYYREWLTQNDDQESFQNGSFQNTNTICDKSSAGFFDIHFDDARFHIRKIELSPQNNILYVGGNAGNIMVINLEQHKYYDGAVKVSNCNLVENYPNFKWKGEPSLILRNDIGEGSNLNFQLIHHLNISPPAPVSSLAINSQSGFLVCGTCHGYVVYDCITQTNIYTKNTCNPKYMVTDGRNIHRRSFIRTLRNSFRRMSLKKTARNNKPLSNTPPAQFTRGSGSVRRRSSHPTKAKPMDVPTNNIDIKSQSIQKSVNIDNIVKQDETMSGYVTVSKIFYGAFKSQFQNNLALLIGTQTGKVYINMLSIEHDPEKRLTQSICCEATKEIVLRHKAYVIDFLLIDHQLNEVNPQRSTPPTTLEETSKVIHHSLIIVTEEQIKIVCLPSLKVKHKLKLTAMTGGRIRKCAFIKTSSNIHSNEYKNYLICLTNWGQLLILNPANLSILKTVHLIQNYDYRAINSVNFSPLGYGYYLCSPTELRRFSISKAEKLFLTCYIANSTNELFHFNKPVENGNNETERHPEFLPQFSNFFNNQIKEEEEEEEEIDSAICQIPPTYPH